jgi:LuxR family maltose regulon positive regulatory protein
LALREQPDVEQAARRFAGDDPLVADYLSEEVLGLLPEDQRAFLIETSVLDRLCGSLCDAVLDQAGSAVLLDGLARANRFVVPLDRRGEWYRCHHLFRDMLRSQLRRLHPSREAELHERASTWLEKRGDVHGAIDHARAASNTTKVAALAWSYAPRYMRSGRAATVGEWLAPLSPDEIAANPALALSKAWWCLAAGNTSEVEQWTAVAERGDADTQLPDGTPLRAAILLLHALVGKRGITHVRDDAALAFDLDCADGSPWRAIARMLEGSALRLLGEVDRAHAALEEGALLAGAFVPGTRAQCLCQLALLDIDRGAWSEAATTAELAMQLVEEHGLGEQPGMAQLYATVALLLAREGSAAEARAKSTHALSLLEVLVDIGPWFVVETRLLLARANQLQGDVATARMCVREAERALSWYPDAGSLPSQVREVKQTTSASALRVGLSATPLTPAELKVLHYLPTHLSFGAIARELFVSRSTVKTQAIAVYRKLGVSSRASAVEHASHLGLLDE